jgi:tRNA-splicing ligase RtcB
MQKINDRLLNWASDIDEGTVIQAQKASRMKIVEGHVALMPDAHVGIGATVGSVIPTKNAVMPAAVGVDIGCGMIASELKLTEGQLPDNLEPLLSRIEKVVPAGLGKWHADSTRAADAWMGAHKHPLTGDQAKKAHVQFGSLGSGNHFFELCIDERGTVWVVLHSGSRGIGNQLASGHIKIAKQMAKAMGEKLEDPDLAYFTQGTPEFSFYIADMLWAQEYAMANRQQMMEAALKEVLSFVGTGQERQRINCHHNFTQQETHDGQELWITRKGAIQADTGRLGVIPGSMGTRSYIVSGLGNPLSWNSCSHGAGRRFSRKRAKEMFTRDDLKAAMKGKTWQSRDAGSLIDESPGAYKDIDKVMEDQKDLVKIEHTLHQVLNYKGTG